MDQVPKFLKALVDEWNPGGYIVSFKVINKQNTSRYLEQPLILFLSSKQTPLFSFQKLANPSNDTDIK